MPANAPEFGAPPPATFESRSASASEARQLLWLAAAVVVVTACLVALALAYLRAEAIDTSERLTESFAQVIEEQTTRTLQSVDQNLQITATRLAQMEQLGTLNEETARQLLRQQLQSMPFARVLWVTDAQGRLLHETGEGHNGTDLSDTAYFKALQAAPQTPFLVAAPVKSKLDGFWLIPAARPLLAADGSFAGTIVASINPLFFDKLWQSIDLGVGGSVSLLRKDGVMMMRSPFHEPSMGKNFGSGLVFTDYLPKTPSGHLQNVSTIDGVSRLFAYRTLSAQPDFVVVVGQSFDRVLQAWKRLAVLVGGIWLAAAVGGLVLCRFLGRAWRQRAQVQAQAVQAAERLRLATDAVGVGIWDWDVSRADQWYASPTYFTMLGYDPQEGLADRAQWLARLHPDDRAPVNTRIQAVLAGDDVPYHYEARMLHADGSYRWISVAGRVLARDANGKATRLIGVRQDITDRKQAEAALRLSEENLSITLQSIGDAVIATDATGNITRMNATAERLTACPLPEALGRPLTEVFRIVNAQTRAPAIDPVHLVMEKGEVVGLANHTALLARDGQEYQIFDSAAPIRDRTGDIVGVVLVFSDVTEQYRVREALAHSETRYRALFEYAPDGILIADANSTYLDANASACRMLGYTRSELIGLHASDIVIPAEVPHIDAALDSIHMQDDYHREWQFRRKNGSVFSAEVMATQMPDGNLMGMLRDVSERKRAEAALREAVVHTQTILDNIVDGVVTFDDRGVVESFNLAASAIFGYAPQHIIGRNAALLIHDPDSHFEEDYLRHRFSSERPRPANISREVQGRRKDGELFPVHLSVSRIFRNGQAHLIAIVRDITQQRHDEEEIRRLAFFDPLTGLPNRRLLMDRLKQAMVTSARTGKHGALMFLDLDHFKLLNDTQGHDVGDLLLQQTATRLTDCVRDGDSVARLGGDEFVVLLEALSANSREAATQAESVATKLLEAFKTPYSLNKYSHEGTTSIGIVVFMGEYDSMDDLLKKADLAMYQGKSAGRNTARFFDPTMQAAVAEHDAREKDLRRGIAMREFVLHYQIQVNDKGQTIGAEALVRWNHGRKGMVAPGQFIALAEQTGLILALGQEVLETACAQLVAWAKQPDKAHWTLAVNVSASQFAQNSFVDNVSRALAQAGANPKLLKLELTESILVHDIEDVIVKMTALQALGVGFSLDDFGTGYSSLSYLKRLPLDQLKIDQSFVRDVLTDPSDAVIARTILALGHSLGLSVIAEGVETEGQHAFLMEAGCDAFQGYYFGRPGPAEALG
ncbi:PAS domain S-box protein [Rhodoferax sp. AJA081-3]|uniref:PAS domain S-box protein n=1 Tax=Rhodoferax sp. AJA081-3 TaxID=2752316 RepID=UPI001ADFE737|nr:PAS domain S-box protein [Rhodoferax sp. AJA081-3]QTN29457.1 PAS domain S-box protein [Rhodoferax sp. AJA081-3]